MSQLEHADFCGSDRLIDWWRWQRRKLPGITGQGNRYSSIQATECNLLILDSLVTKICPCELMSAVYCIAWSFFSLQQAKTCKSRKYSKLNGATL